MAMFEHRGSVPDAHHNNTLGRGGGVENLVLDTYAKFRSTVPYHYLILLKYNIIFWKNRCVGALRWGTLTLAPPLWGAPVG